MIALLRGSVAAAELDRAIIDVGGVGYEVFATRRALEAWSTEAEVTVHISTQVRAESITLFGFQEPDERLAFLALMTVSQVGPKVALAALDALTLPELRRAVEGDDVRALGSIKGVGPKTAKRLALELKGKLPVGAFTPTPSAVPTPTPDADRALVLALEKLGFKRSEIQHARDKLIDHGVGADAPVPIKLRTALRIIHGN